MENDTAHDLSEFNFFPWDRLENSVNWREIDAAGGTTEFQVDGITRGGVTGGMDFNPMRPHIDFLRSDASVDAWEVPKSLEVLIDVFYNRGKQHREDEIRNQAKRLAQTLLGDLCHL